MLRIRSAVAIEGFRVRLVLTDGRSIERNLGSALQGAIFEPIRGDRTLFQALRVEGGTLVWPNGADLCPDVVIWGGAPPASEETCALPLVA